MSTGRDSARWRAQNNSHLLRTTYKAEAGQARARIAAVAGVPKEEIALTRGGTEALQNLIAGYRRLRPGDAVMYSDLDYHSIAIHHELAA